MEDSDYEKKLKEILHFFNVSLKNNKGLENIKLYLENIIELYDLIIYLYLEKLKEKGLIEDIDEAPKKRYNVFKSFMKDNNEILEILNDYEIIRKLKNCELRINDEYRKSAKIICEDYDNTIEIDQKDLKRFLENLKKFVVIMENYIK